MVTSLLIDTEEVSLLKVIYLLLVSAGCVQFDSTSHNHFPSFSVMSQHFSSFSAMM